MGRRAWTFAAVVAVLAAGAWWWLSCAHDPSAPDAPRPPANAVGSPPVAASAARERTVEGAVASPARVAPVEPARLVVGPKGAHERVAVPLAPARAPMLVGRLLRDGAPAKSTAVSVEIGEAAAGAGTPTTDDEGRFRIALAATWLDRRIDAMQFEAREDHGTWRGELVLSAGDHELGDIVLVPLPVIVAGALVGAGGSAAPQGAGLAIQHEPAGGDAWQWAKVSLPRKPDGTFLARGDVPRGALRLVVFGNNFAPVAPLPFVAGARDVRIELRAGGSLRAAARVGSPIAGHCMEPLLVPADATTPASVLVPLDLQLDSRVPAERRFVRDEPLTQQWTWPALAPGRYRLEVRLRGQRDPSLVVPDLIVADGERNEDPRCQDLTIAGLQTIHITVPQADTAERSSPTSGGGFVFVLDGDEPTARCVQLDGSLAFFTVTRPLDVLVRVPGCRDKVVRGIIADTTVGLEPGIPVVLRSAGQAAPVGEITWSLTPLDDRAAAVRAVIYSPAAGGSLPIPLYEGTGASAVAATAGATLRVCAPGRYRITARVKTTADGERLAACEPAEVQVPADGCAVAVTVR